MRAARRLLPSLATNGCRQHLSSTAPISTPRQHSDAQAIDGDRATNPSKIQPARKAIVVPRKDLRVNKGTPLWVSFELEELLFPRAKARLTRHIPLEAAAEIVKTVRSVPDGQPTPPDVVAEVLKCAERAYPSEPLRAIYWIAMSLTRPGESHSSVMNSDLIARLLNIAKGDPDGPYGQSKGALGALFGTLRNRVRRGGEILLTDYNSEARSEYERLAATGGIPPNVFRTRMTVVICRESDSEKRDALVRTHLQDFIHIYRHSADSVRIPAMLQLGVSYAEGIPLPRDGRKARLWWERSLIHGIYTLGPNSMFVGQAAYELARVYFGQPAKSYGTVPLFAPDFSKAFRYLHLAKWSDDRAASFLGKLYYLNPRRAHWTSVQQYRLVQQHISAFGVVPDDTLAAEAFVIGAERFNDGSCKYMLAEMLYQRRASPPANPYIVKTAVLPAPPRPVPDPIASADGWPDDDSGADDILESLLSMDTDGPSIEFATCSRRDTLVYAWQLLEPILNGEHPELRKGKRDPLVRLILEEARRDNVELSARKERSS